MPWKGEKDPYRIWLSEVILQQTRVEQGLGYYNRFIKRYATIKQLSNAKDETVYKLWEGLGYYTRCRNLLVTARYIAREKQGRFPDTYEEILKLKGVGPYIAAAIASFAYNLPHAVLDGNVFRVLSRIYGVDTPIDSLEGKKQFTALSQENLDKQHPGEYNQAIMDFGATVCKPMIPLCSSCPMKRICVAYQEGWVNQLPVKEKTLHKRKRWFYYFLFEVNNRYMVHQRTAKDIWQHLHEFYLFESPEKIGWDQLVLKTWLSDQLGVKKFEITHVSEVRSQQLTHQTLTGQLIKIKLDTIPASLEHYNWVLKKQLLKLAFPKFINQFLQPGIAEDSAKGTSE